MDNKHTLGLLQIGTAITGYNNTRIKKIQQSPFCSSVTIEFLSDEVYSQFVKVLSETILRFTMEVVKDTSKIKKDEKPTESQKLMLQVLKDAAEIIKDNHFLPLSQVWICDDEKYCKTITVILLTARYQLTSNCYNDININFFTRGADFTPLVLEILQESSRDVLKDKKPN